MLESELLAADFERRMREIREEIATMEAAKAYLQTGQPVAHPVRRRKATGSTTASETATSPASTTHRRARRSRSLSEVAESVVIPDTIPEDLTASQPEASAPPVAQKKRRSPRKKTAEDTPTSIPEAQYKTGISKHHVDALIREHDGLSFEEICELTSGDPEKLSNVLKMLERDGLSRKLNGREGTRWYAISEEEQEANRIAELERILGDDTTASPDPEGSAEVDSTGESEPTATEETITADLPPVLPGLLDSTVPAEDAADLTSDDSQSSEPESATPTVEESHENTPAAPEGESPEEPEMVERADPHTEAESANQTSESEPVSSDLPLIDTSEQVLSDLTAAPETDSVAADVVITEPVTDTPADIITDSEDDENLFAPDGWTVDPSPDSQANLPEPDDSAEQQSISLD
jgi:DNA-binding MarR family transcriptional regulator